MGDLISREALKKEFDSLLLWKSKDIELIKEVIDNAPTVELDEGVIQEVLKKRCMTVITNEYLISLITSNGKRTKGEWIKKFNEVSYWYECDQCGERPARNYLGDDYLSRFCSNCGAQMQEGGAI